MAFTTRYDSSPPSTPAKHRGFGSSISTTPAAPLPSSAASFTPLGPPPSTVFGSSQLGSERVSNFSESNFDQSFNSQSDHDLLSFSAASSNFPLPRSRNAPLSGFLSQQSEASPLRSQFRSVLGGDHKRADTPKLGRFAQPVDYREEDNGLENGRDNLPFDDSIFASSTNSQPLRQPRKSGIYSNPNNAKRAKLDESWAQPPPVNKPRDLKQKKSSTLPSIARNFATRSTPVSIDEPSGLLLDTEDAMCRMYDKVRDHNADDTVLQSRLSEISEEVANMWTKYAAESTSSAVIQNSGAIGPGESAPGIAKAAFLSTLLLQLHHPPLVGSKTKHNKMSAGSRAPFRSLVVADQPQSISPVPKVLFDWLAQHHDPHSTRLDLLNNVQPNPTASPTFWNVILSAVLRAKFSSVIELLENADFNYARTAMEDGYDQPGYHGSQLQNIQRCVNKALQFLRSSPGMQYNDWDIKDFEWAMFRKQLISAIIELEDSVEGPDLNQSGGSETFSAPHFGISSQQQNLRSFSYSARMADSRLPWSIYQNIKAMYNIMVGNVDAILNNSEDWVEATVALAAWWDGDDDNEIVLESNTTRKVSARQPVSNAPRSVDSNPGEAYLRRLDYSFSSVTDTLGQDGFQINSMNPCEVGLASIFEGSIESVFRILQTWSLPITAATAEIASFGGWLSTSTGSEPMHGFNESDLLVLSYGQKEKPLQKDDILVDYSSGVFSRGRLESPSGGKDGWELSLEILSRVDSQETMKANVKELIDRVDLDSSDQMEKVVVLCAELGFREEALGVSERYGDKVAQTSEAYGMALICYGRAHCAQKIKNVIDLLISFCLIQSRAYPAKSDLDDQLKSLLYDSTSSLSAIASVDAEGAAMLQFYFSSYATLRFYYDIRDEEIYLEAGQRPKYRPLARKKEAADCLVAVIRSAADSIYGGLYDQDRKSATQVDGLLVLLGEALTILEPDPNHFLSTDQQLTILAAIEDLQTVTNRVYDQCEECLQSSLYHHLHYNNSSATSSSSFSSSSFPAAPQNLLKKSISASTEMSGFSLIGSEMLESSQSGSGVLVPRPGMGNKGKGGEINRGWDWREKVPENAKGVDILKRLRLLLAKGLAFGALGGI